MKHWRIIVQQKAEINTMQVITEKAPSHTMTGILKKKMVKIPVQLTSLIRNEFKVCTAATRAGATVGTSKTATDTTTTTEQVMHAPIELSGDDSHAGLQRLASATAVATEQPDLGQMVSMIHARAVVELTSYLRAACMRLDLHLEGDLAVKLNQGAHEGPVYSVPRPV